MKTIAVIPVHGRLSILQHTIRRLYQVNKVNHVICVGGEEEKETCIRSGAEFVEHPNEPLGRKWNAGFRTARAHSPDAVLYLGSTNWLSQNWTDIMSQALGGAMMAGKPDFNILNKDDMTMIRWMHYPRERPKLKHYLNKGKLQFMRAGGRMNEPVGIGRMLRADFLDAVNWEPLDPERNNFMDGSMMQSLSEIKGNYSLIKQGNIQSLKISTSKWSSLNTFDMYKKYGVVKDNICPIEFLVVWFPEALKLEL